ncbi:hypothetical protein BJ741DRAFT_663091 [Chytriomyces cf. hyalinus JEL632]|nr:hypothetical protein BJ741DRAFT_663091 [Chytriomyces cf. hyalinus JEL632]
MIQFATLAALASLLFVAGTANAQSQLPPPSTSTSTFAYIGAGSVVAVLAVGLVAVLVSRSRSNASQQQQQQQSENGFGDVENVYDFYTQDDMSLEKQYDDDAPPELVAIHVVPDAAAVMDREDVVSLTYASSSRSSILSVSSSIMYPDEHGEYSDCDEMTVEDIVSVYSYEMEDDHVEVIGFAK